MVAAAACDGRRQQHGGPSWVRASGLRSWVLGWWWCGDWLVMVVGSGPLHSSYLGVSGDGG